MPSSPRPLASPTACVLLLCGVLGAVLGAPVVAGATADPHPGLVALVEGREVPLPTLKIDTRARIQGDLASVTLTQTFENPYGVPIHARYVFPLPPDAAVHAMRLVSGDRMIEAQIQSRPEARAVYENARERGNQAALVEQHRPNVFTQEVANLTPGAPVRVELEYAHVVTKSHGIYRFHFPMVVGPRFLPTSLAHSGVSAGAPTRVPGEPEALAVGVWNLPASATVAPPERVDHERVSLRIELDGGVPLQWVESPSHPLEMVRVSDSERLIGLSEGATLDNQDFELHYRLAGDGVATGITTFANDGDGFLSLLIEPPTHASDAEIARRELVFVLDCSGSMQGIPLAASKRFMRRTLENLRPGDSFRIIRFSDSATAWSEVPVPATKANIRKGIRYVDSLYGSGGTHMASGIRAALAAAVPEDALRLVVFLTDGYIGNDVEIVRLLQQQLGEARLFSFGIGSSVNRYLIEEMGRVGRGTSRIVRPTEDAEAAADELVERLAAPVLTDIEIDWGDADVEEVFPSRIPDLFMGQTVRVMGRYRKPGSYRATLRGRMAGAPAALPFDVDLPAHDPGFSGRALPTIWARSQIEDRMIQYLSPGITPQLRDDLEREVTELGLAHSLMTQWTSFVAVAREVVNPGGQGVPVDVEVPQAAGVPDSAYPPSALGRHRKGSPGQPGSAGATQLVLAAPGGSAAGALPPLAAGGFQGSSGPEPSTWLALLAIGIAGGVLSRRRGTAQFTTGG